MKSAVLILLFSVFCFTSPLSAQNRNIDSKTIQKVIKSGNETKLQRLIDNGLDVNKRLSNGETLLLYALSTSQDFNLAQLLIDEGADTNLPSLSGMTPLILATGIVPTIENSGKVDTPKSKIVRFQLENAKKMVEFLLKNGADINQETPFGTPLMNACTGGWNIEVAEMLIENGADINQKDTHGRTALFYAGAYNLDDVELMLIKNNANISVRDNEGKYYTDVTKEEITDK